MGSINISLNEEAYNSLKRAKKENESFSQAVVRITSDKDIMSCAGALEDSAGIEIIEKEAKKSRERKWRHV
ncbi:MAG: antitoxin VapB family protein [Candidatus Micrarchaeota archaeon]